MNPNKALGLIGELIIKNPDLQPRPDGTTFCNVAVQKMASVFDVDFGTMNANGIYQYLLSKCNSVSGDEASKRANLGELIIAAQAGNPHGHVAVCYPGPMVFSGKWNKNCPMLINVGEKNELFGANWGFKNEPQYFALC